MAQYNYPAKEELSFPNQDMIESEEIIEFDDVEQADEQVNQYVTASGEGVLTDPGVQNGPVYEIVKTYVLLVGAVVKYVVHRVLYYLTTPTAKA